MTVRIISSVNLSYEPVDVFKDVPMVLRFDEINNLNISNSLNYSLSESKKYISNVFNYTELDVKDSITSITYDNKFTVELTSITDYIFKLKLPFKDTGFNLDSIESFVITDVGVDCEYYNKTPLKDFGSEHKYRHVYIFDEKIIPPNDVRYLPTSDFGFSDEIIGFTSDFINPIDYDNLKTRLSPLINVVQSLPWSKAYQADIYQELKWGYSYNNFLIGGSVDTKYQTDPDAIEIPPEPPVNQEVITFVNIVNIVTLPDRTSVQFSNLSLAYDLDSVSWVISFDVGTEAMRNLVKPDGLTVTELEVNVNGELYIVFIARTSTTKGINNKGVVEKRIKCSGWSVHKLLSYPYHARRSHVEISNTTPAGILNEELTGTGFTGTWNSVSWTIPANMFTYIDKAPLAAISDLVQVVGAVIIPDPASKSFDIKPRYPTSPWVWDSVGVDINLNESNFFSIDTEWIPQESPDSIYIYGDSVTGVAVKAVRTGQPGTKTLPTIVNKYFTDTVPAIERGRIEVAKNGYKEIVPISTYVNPVDGILKPLQLVQVTETDGITTWRGQIVGISLNLKQQGNALVQTIQLERHYDI